MAPVFYVLKMKGMTGLFTLMFYVEHFSFSTSRAWADGWSPPSGTGKALDGIRRGRAESRKSGLSAFRHSLSSPGAENKSGATWKG